eukprot:IDg3784t1
MRHSTKEPLGMQSGVRLMKWGERIDLVSRYALVNKAYVAGKTQVKDMQKAIVAGSTSNRDRGSARSLRRAPTATVLEVACAVAGARPARGRKANIGR